MVTTDGDVDMQEPHRLGFDAMDKLFPVLEAPPADVNIEHWEPVEGEQKRSTGKCSVHGELQRAGNLERLRAALATW